MSLHVSAGTECNMGCTYCYEEPDREINGKEDDMAFDYDMDAILDRLSEWKEKYPNKSPGLHGGEPLLMANDDIEQVFAYMDEHWDSNPSIQTNGSLIKQEHIDIFQKYDVGVGISCDGPPALNKERKARKGGDDVTEEFSLRTNRAITRLREAGVGVGVIVVLSKANAGTDEKLEKLLSWLDNLCRMGVGGHFNPAIPYDDIQNDVSLSPERMGEVYEQAVEWMFAEEHRDWGPFNDHLDNLMGNGLSNCVNNKCDVSNAGAARIIKGNGETTGCGKTWETYGDGVNFLQGDSSGNEYEERQERYDMLKELPGWTTEGEEDLGGCKGCKYWSVCQGGCPSAGLNDDWRNRTIWCQAKYASYEAIEDHLRSTMRNIRLITDIPWNAEVSDDLKWGRASPKPFEEVRPGTPGPSSANGGTHARMPPIETFGEIDDIIPGNDFETRKKFWLEYAGPERVDADPKTGQINVSSTGKASPNGESEDTPDDSDSGACGCSTCQCGSAANTEDDNDAPPVTATGWEQVDDTEDDQ